MNKPTPTRHARWRVIDGQLVDESTLPAATPSSDTRAATEPDLVDADQAGPAEAHAPFKRRHKAPSTAD